MLSLAEYGMPWVAISHARAKNIVEGKYILQLSMQFSESLLVQVHISEQTSPFQ
jgi:hypothetical protein